MDNLNTIEKLNFYWMDTMFIINISFSLCTIQSIVEGANCISQIYPKTKYVLVC